MWACVPVRVKDNYLTWTRTSGGWTCADYAYSEENYCGWEDSGTACCYCGGGSVTCSDTPGWTGDSMQTRCQHTTPRMQSSCHLCIRVQPIHEASNTRTCWMHINTFDTDPEGWTCVDYLWSPENYCGWAVRLHLNEYVPTLLFLQTLPTTLEITAGRR